MANPFPPPGRPSAITRLALQLSAAQPAQHLRPAGQGWVGFLKPGTVSARGGKPTCLHPHFYTAS